MFKEIRLFVLTRLYYIQMNDTSIRTSIAANLKKARKKNGLTQLEVAKKADTTDNYYAKLERGEVMPSIKMLERLVEALGVSSSDILPF